MSLKDNRFTGVLPTVLTPLQEDLTSDDKMLLGHCRWLLAIGAVFLEAVDGAPYRTRALASTACALDADV